MGGKGRVEMEKEKQGNWFQRHKILTGIIAFIFIIAIASSASDNDAKVVENSQTDSSSSQSDDAQTLEKTEFKVGEIISFDYKEVTVLGTTRNWSSGNQLCDGQCVYRE